MEGVRNPGLTGVAALLPAAAALLLSLLSCNGAPVPEQPRPPEDSPAATEDTVRCAPGTTPEGTAGALYGDSVFFTLRNEISLSAIERLSPCITADLRAHFERHIEEVEAWMARNEGANLKLPVPTGPIFLSRYEGADSFEVGEARIDGDTAETPVSLSITDDTGTLEWVDVAVMRKEGDVWLLDNIVFDSDGARYTLRDRVSLEE